MRDIKTFQSFEDIKILTQYLWITENDLIVECIADEQITIWMDEYMDMHVISNNGIESLERFCSNELLIYLVSVLKKQKAIESKVHKNRWAEIQFYVSVIEAREKGLML